MRIVYAFTAVSRQGRIGVEQLADMFMPLYMWRAAAFASHTALESPDVVQARLDSLCETFERLKPVLGRRTGRPKREVTMIQDIADALLQSWRNFASAFVLFVPRLVAATIIFAGGLVVSLIARRVVQRLLVWLRFDRLSLRTGASELLRKAEMPTADVLDRKDGLLDRLDRFHRVGGGHAAVQAVSGTRRRVLPVRSPLPGRAPGAVDGVPGRQFPLARDAAVVGQRRPARRASAERRPAGPGDCDRRRDGPRTTGAGDVCRADRVRDHVRRGDAGPGDRLRAGRAGRREATARAAGLRPRRNATPTPRLTCNGDAVQSCERRAPPPDIAAGSIRHRGSRPRRLRVHRVSRVRRSAAVAGVAARADRLRRLAVPVLFGVCGQSAARSASTG